ncbi:hypothetical protein CWE13_12280 [Aliidiomarina shirensis]|uniref:Uncharacterized protein n=1 Tax=Aliidiomarina shirensis TaxID=1048642 RepID=A0A432WKQ7_9GAMM|nr:hypothetical protein [Aliidiomarina shirensis]RUO34396.1 hypothetical protein CWE13_12280 [Aliidiomarina shirensis]
MSKYASVLISATFLMLTGNAAAFSSDGTTNEDKMVELYSKAGSLHELRTIGAISSERYTEFLANGLTPDTRMELKYRRLASVHTQRSAAYDSESGNDKPNEQEERWQRVENGATYQYVERKRYFEDRGWQQVYFSRTLIE